MSKTKYLIIALISMLLLIMPITVNATDVTVSRNIYSNNGSMKFTFNGLTLDTQHEYEFGLTKTASTQVETWHLITDLSETSATIDIMTTSKDLREVINAVDTGFVTIKDKTEDTVILEPYGVDLKTPYLRLANYTVIPNGKQFGSSESEGINIALRNANNSKAYYQYEKITNEAIVKKYKEIKNNGGDYLQLESMLKTTAPASNWSSWNYWNNHDLTGMNGYGYTERNISAPDTGLYYMWIYFSGNNIKPVYGYILVDNLQPEIKLESISLPGTREVALGSSTTLTATFVPSNATNKIVTWTSSDESVATVDNAGKITPKKLGSTIITVTSQDGNKKATCTVTVTEGGTNNSGNNNGGTNNPETTTPGTNNGGSNKPGTTTPTTNGKTDTTTATGKLPYTGVVSIVTAIVLLVAISVFAFIKYYKYRDIK